MSSYKAIGHTVFKKEGGKLKKVGTTKGRVQDYLAALYMHADKGKKKK